MAAAPVVTTEQVARQTKMENQQSEHKLQNYIFVKTSRDGDNRGVLGIASSGFKGPAYLLPFTLDAEQPRTDNCNCNCNCNCHSNGNCTYNKAAKWYVAKCVDIFGPTLLQSACDNNDDTPPQPPMRCRRRRRGSNKDNQPPSGVDSR